MRTRALLILLLTLLFASLCVADLVKELDDFYYDYEESECLWDEGSPCRNGGRCVDEWGTYRCVCPRAFTGKDCEIPVNETCFLQGCGLDGECVFLEQFGRPMCQCNGSADPKAFCDDRLKPTTPPPTDTTPTSSTVAPPTTTTTITTTTSRPAFVDRKSTARFPKTALLLGIIAVFSALATVSFAGVVWLSIRTFRKRRELREANRHPSEPPSPKTITTVA